MYYRGSWMPAFAGMTRKTPRPIICYLNLIASDRLLNFGHCDLFDIWDL
jgi:hypothetical protein